MCYYLGFKFKVALNKSIPIRSTDMNWVISNFSRSIREIASRRNVLNVPSQSVVEKSVTALLRSRAKNQDLEEVLSNVTIALLTSTKDLTDKSWGMFWSHVVRNTAHRGIDVRRQRATRARLHTSLDELLSNEGASEDTVDFEDPEAANSPAHWDRMAGIQRGETALEVLAKVSPDTRQYLTRVGMGNASLKQLREDRTAPLSKVREYRKRHGRNPPAPLMTYWVSGWKHEAQQMMHAIEEGLVT